MLIRLYTMVQRTESPTWHYGNGVSERQNGLCFTEMETDTDEWKRNAGNQA